MRFRMPTFFLFVFAILSRFALLHSAEDTHNHSPVCPKRFSCGKLGDLKFPYSKFEDSPTCGLLYVKNCSEQVQWIQLEKNGRWYTIEDISEADTMTIVDPLLQGHINSSSCKIIEDLSPPSSPLFQPKATSLENIFMCNQTLPITPKDFNYERCKDEDYSVYYSLVSNTSSTFPSECSKIQLPIDRRNNRRDLFSILSARYHLNVTLPNGCGRCYLRGGQCKLKSKDKFECVGDTKGNSNTTFAFKAAIAASGATIGFVMLLVFCFRRKLFALCTMQTEDDHNVENILRNFGIFPERYSYSDVKRSTNNFKDKLGEGGYGSVYKGKLHDGRFVAVKMLNNTKGNGEEFINEIASISRTSHVNIVSLVGFCCEKTKRALLYEYMPNGSLEKFIFNAKPNNRKLGWETLYEISLGIARGLEYLHRGCSTRILHFDIKPHNILLDQHLVPKIADFGLAKICSREESIMSMMGARGTIGYIAPEVFCRNFGGVSYKSDVYSYGMMVLEMVGGRKNIDVNVDNLSAIYFPHWIYKRIEVEEELELEGVLNEEDEDKARKMIIVSLWCIQSDPSVRPTMSKVVEMLEGNVASIKIPPKPYLSSPPRSPINSSTTILT